MTNNIGSNKRIAKNTLFMYFRMVLVMVIMLFTSRINLESLGVLDYGIYSVVGGFVAMFSMFSNALSSAIQRFITFELGNGNKERIKSVFSTSVTIMILLSVLLMIMADLAGIWFIHNEMVLPKERIEAATWVLHFSVLTFGIGLVSVPCNATIIAHERMSAFAYISIYEVCAKLIVCYCLLISPIDRLVLWAIMLACIQISINILYAFYCYAKFEECKYRPMLDKPLLKEIAEYAGWSTFGLVALTCYTQGLNMLLNVFFGPIVNAARSISVQVQHAVQGFSTNFQIALNPQIIKNYALGDLNRMHNLLFTGTRFCFYMLLILSLPIILETPTILKIWLGEYPDYTIEFIRLVLVIIMFDSSLGGPISTAQTATGKIKIYQLVVGGTMLMILPVSYLILKIWNSNPETVYYVYLIAVIVAHVLRMIIIRSMINLSLRQYVKEVVKPILLVVLTSLPMPLILYVFLPKESYCSFFIVCIVSVLSVAMSVYTLGIKSEERALFKSKMKYLLHIR